MRCKSPLQKETKKKTTKESVKNKIHFSSNRNVVGICELECKIHFAQAEKRTKKKKNTTESSHNTLRYCAPKREKHTHTHLQHKILNNPACDVEIPHENC